MAGFVKVMRAAQRMCNTFEHCSECPMTSTASGCVLGLFDSDNSQEIEKIVMKWVRENEKTGRN